MTLTKKEEYIFEIIHDLKAPILSMDYALKNIRRDDFLNEIYKINRHNLSYIENMITNYTIDKGIYCPKIEEINLVELIKEELKVLNFISNDKNLRINFSYDKLNKHIIKTDVQILRQIILNLLTNAVKYTPDNKEIKIIIEEEEKYIKICFENFDDKPNKKTQSTKLGLEIVKKKIKALKGKFKIQKTKEDICFSIYFEK